MMAWKNAYVTVCKWESMMAVLMVRMKLKDQHLGHLKGWKTANSCSDEHVTATILVDYHLQLIPLTRKRDKLQKPHPDHCYYRQCKNQKKQLPAEILEKYLSNPKCGDQHGDWHEIKSFDLQFDFRLVMIPKICTNC